MHLDDYQREAAKNSRVDWSDPQSRHIPALGLLSEVGSLAGEAKKIIRDGAAYTDGYKSLQIEFGDALWYVAEIATRAGVSLGELRSPPGSPSRDGLKHIYRLAYAVSALMSTPQSLIDSGSTSELRRAIAEALNALLDAMHAEQMDLEEICRLNLAKGSSYFGGLPVGPAPLLDADYPLHEQLPRRIDINVLELARGSGKVEVILRAHGLNIGDRLTDNSHTDDGYRFHDAFHLAYVAVLGWSPVSRALFRCKRKSVGEIDEVQDGARAAIVEEAITHTMWDYARGVSMLNNVDRIDHNILTLVQRMVRGLEVEACALYEWQRAFIVGFEAFRRLRANGGGWLRLDADRRALDYFCERPV